MTVWRQLRKAFGRSGRNPLPLYVAEGYWPATAAGDGREVITHHFIRALGPDEALSIAGARDVRTVWCMAYLAEDLCDLRDRREFEFLRATGRRHRRGRR